MGEAAGDNHEAESEEIYVVNSQGGRAVAGTNLPRDTDVVAVGTTSHQDRVREEKRGGGGSLRTTAEEVKSRGTRRAIG